MAVSLTHPQRCDDCDYAPCEAHGIVLVRREGASMHTADELALQYLSDALDCDPDCMSAYGRIIYNEASAALQGDSGWIGDGEPDSDGAMLAQELGEVARQVESYLFGLLTIWDDGYQIVQVTGGPLLD